MRLPPEEDPAEAGINLAMPNDRSSKRIRLFVDHIVSHFQRLQQARRGMGKRREDRFSGVLRPPMQ